MPKEENDIYFATRLLMMSYWLTCPLLTLLFFGLLKLFPRVEWKVISVFLRRHWVYLRNLVPFIWVILGVILVVNTVLTLFYLIDVLAIGNDSKYSVYWASHGNSSPLLTFFSIIFFGSIFYWVVAVIGYKRYWISQFNLSLSKMLRI